MSEEKYQLLVFAHRGEAKAFLKYFDASIVNFVIDGLLQSKQLFFLVSGEGGIATSQSLAAVLGAYHQKISSVIHIGIAGALDPGLSPGAIYPIRTFYASNATEMRFKSFSTDSSTALMDCVSADRRVQDVETATRLSCFAPLVDREGWYAASVSRLFRKPFKAVKLISDDARSPLDQATIAASAENWSKALLDWFKDNIKMKKPGVLIEPGMNDLLPDDFYATTAQKRQIRALLEKINMSSTKEIDITEIVDFDYIRKETTRPKKRTALLIRKFQEIANPLQNQYGFWIADKLQPLRDRKIEVLSDRNLESHQLQLRMTLSDNEDLIKLREALNAFDYQAVIDIFNGRTEQRD